MTLPAELPRARPELRLSANGGAGGRVVVTGCAGFIGSHLCSRLLDLGHTVLGIDCFTDYYSPVLKGLNVEQLRSNARFTLTRHDLGGDPLDELLEGSETVFHLAAQPGVRASFGAGFESYLRNNILASQRLFEAAAAANVGRVVYSSSSSVYGDALRHPTGEDCERRPRSPYGLTKLTTEELAGVYERSDGLAAIGLRYFTVYGPRQRPDMAFTRFIANGLAKQPISVMGDGEQVRDFTFVDDAVEATIAAGSRGTPGAVYNIGGGTRVRLSEAIGVIEDLLGRPLRVEHQPVARGDVRRTCADPNRARDELGFRTAFELRAGLERQVDWALSHTEAVCSAVAA